MTRNLARSRSRTATRAALGAVVVALAATACGPHPQTSIAIRSTALNLQFARPDLAKPIPPKVILRLLPAPPAAPPAVGGSMSSTGAPPVPVFPPQSAGRCPRATAPARLAEVTAGSPKAGYYRYDTKGTATVSGGKQNVHAPVPARTQVAISRSHLAAPDATVAAEGGAPASGKETEYTVTTHLSDNVSQVDELMVSASSINLVQRTLSDGERTMLFTPTPQVQLMKFGPVGTSWKSSGNDSNSGSVMDYQGSITATKVLTICGQPVRTYQVTYSESLTNPAEGEIIRTSSSDPNTFSIAPQLGGLVIARHVDTDDIRFEADLSGYIGVTLDYTSTLARLTPSSTVSGP